MPQVKVLWPRLQVLCCTVYETQCYIMAACAPFHRHDDFEFSMVTLWLLP